MGPAFVFQEDYMHTIDDGFRYGFGVILSHNSDWSGDVLVRWTRDPRGGASDGETSVNSEALLSGYIPDSCQAPRDVMCRAVALANRSYARTRMVRAAESL